MKLKYYLRGLGIGIFVTGIVMGVSNRSAVSQAKAEVRKFYEQESSVEDAADGTSIVDFDAKEPVESMPERNDEIESEIHSAIEGALAAEDQMKTGEEGASQEADVSEPASSGEESPVVIINPSNEAASGEGITIEVLNGDDSSMVSRKLYNAGIIDNASDYDAFLMQHGYDKRIKPGTKEIYAEDSWQTIAEKLAKN